MPGGRGVAMGGIRIENGGALSTIQDAGRIGYQALGFGTAGAMDVDALKLANTLLGNEPDEAVIEMTLLGMEVVFEEANCFVLTGGDMGATLNGDTIDCCKVYAAKSGDILKCGFCKDGIRGYLSFAGGMDIMPVLGSLSTSMKYQLGGLEGRKLMPGDTIGFKNPKAKLSHMKRRFIEAPIYKKDVTELRVLLGFQKDYFTEEGLQTFFSSVYGVQSESDRMGYRLEGEAIGYKDTVDIVSDAIVPGAIQVPSNGQPIVLMADRQTTGGYAKIGAVISADLPLLAQMAPGSKVCFKEVTLEEAQAALVEKRIQMKQLKRRLERWF